MAETTGSRDRFLRNVLILCICIAMAFILYHVLYVVPSFTRLLVQTTQDDAVRITRHLAFSMLALYKDPLGKTPLDVRFLKRESAKAARDFQLTNLKVYSPSGEVLFSIDPGEVGMTNVHGYFHDIIARGEVYTRLVPKDEESLEGQKMAYDVLETYVPLMRDGRFLGVLEIYYEITEGRAELSRLISRSSAIALVLALGLLGAIGFMLLQENAARKRRRELEAERVQKERLQGVIEMAGAACHELNQPLQAIVGCFHSMLTDLPKESPLLGTLTTMRKKLDQMGQVTGKIMNITRYETRDYGDGHKIIDIDRASSSTRTQESGTPGASFRAGE